MGDQSFILCILVHNSFFDFIFIIVHLYVEISEKASACIEITKKEERSLARQASSKEKENTCTLIGQHICMLI